MVYNYIYTLLDIEYLYIEHGLICAWTQVHSDLDGPLRRSGSGLAQEFSSEFS